MSIRSPQAHYLRLSSELSVENGAIQDPSASRWKCQPQQWDPRLKLILRWLGTLAFVISLYVILYDYERKGTFSPGYKKRFTFLTTALVLGLALNLLEGLKEFAKIYRWKLWTDTRFTLQEAQLILGIESLLTVCKLLWLECFGRRRRIWRWKIPFLCIIWLVINLGAQVLNALIGITYEVKDGISYNDTYLTDGLVRARNLTAYFNMNESLSDEDNQAVAHSWGEISSGLESCGPYNDITDISNSKYDPPYYCRRTPGQQEFAYRFKDYNPSDTEGTYPFLTNRIITVSSGTCFRYEVPNASPPETQCIDSPALNYTFHNSTYTSSICIPKCSDGWAATIYMYRGTKTPVRDEANSCGDRCKWIWAFRTSGQNPDPQSPPVIFQCPITVSEVSHTTMDAQRIPDSVARVAAASIALQGRWTGPVDNKTWTQYQFNAFNTPWEVHNLSDERAGANMAEFALRSLAGMVEANPVISLPGKVPHLGSHLTIHKRFCHGVLIPLGVGHLAFCIVGFWLKTKSVEPKDDSYTGIARLLSERYSASTEYSGQSYGGRPG